MDYRGIKFPPYKYQEYPKKLVRPDGTRVWVKDMREELAALQSPEFSSEPTQAELDMDKLRLENARQAQELATMKEQLATLGVAKAADGKPLDKPAKEKAA
jgi:hypothetical protein